MTTLCNGSKATPLFATAAVDPVKLRYIGTVALSLVNTAYCLAELAARTLALVVVIVVPVETVAEPRNVFGASDPKDTLDGCAKCPTKRTVKTTIRETINMSFSFLMVFYLITRYCIPVIAPVAGVFVPPVELTTVTVITSAAETVAPMIGKPELVVAPTPAFVE